MLAADAVSFDVIGEPTDVASAAQLAADDPNQFPWWALGLVGARPAEQEKGADKGIDGRLFFHEQQGGATSQVIVSVKAGHTGVAHVRDLRGHRPRGNRTMSTSYLENFSSTVTTVIASKRACAMSIRSNGSLWCGGSSPAANGGRPGCKRQARRSSMAQSAPASSISGSPVSSVAR